MEHKENCLCDKCVLERIRVKAVKINPEQAAKANSQNELFGIIRKADKLF